MPSSKFDPLLDLTPEQCREQVAAMLAVGFYGRSNRRDPTRIPLRKRSNSPLQALRFLAKRGSVYLVFRKLTEPRTREVHDENEHADPAGQTRGDVHGRAGPRYAELFCERKRTG